MRYWNLSRKSRDFRGADGYVVSIPKCGRTWLYFLTQHYICAKAGVPFELSAGSRETPLFPNIRYTHDLWTHRSSRSALDRLRGKHLIPEDCRAEKPVVLLTRDLRDVMVSLYFQVTRREDKFSGTLTEMLDDPVLGAAATVDIIGRWWEEWHASPRFLHLTYEALQDAPEEGLARVLVHFGERRPDAGLIAEAVEFARFDNMQRMERENLIPDKILTPGDADDPDSFKVRQGVVGGYRETMTEQDIAIVERAMGALPRDLGPRPGPANGGARAVSPGR